MNLKYKKAIFAIISIFLILVLIELLSFVFFTQFKNRFTFFDVNLFLLRDTAIRFSHLEFNSERGWDNKYNTPFGERPRGVFFNKPYISSFGDSFTHCDQVKHNETWQEGLSFLLKKDVYNFGTGGYGTDQAYMKFLEKYPNTKTPIVILGLITENINRIVNVYRPFYFSKTGLKITKPRFLIKNDELFLLKNPVGSEQEIANLRSPEFINKIGETDFWFNRNRYPVLAFPYTKILFNNRIWLEQIYNKKGFQIDDISPRPWENLWKNKEATGIIFKIFESFVEKVRAEKAIPIIMVIPNRHEVTTKLQTGHDAEKLLQVQEFCMKNNCRFFSPTDGFVEHLKKGNKFSSLYKVHITPKGNLIIANQLFQYLKSIDAQ